MGIVKSRRMNVNRKRLSLKTVSWQSFRKLHPKHPKALAPQIAMTSAHLTAYKPLREFIVPYLKSKNLWKRGAGTAFGSASASAAPAPYSGPAPMEIGAVDATDAARAKGKEAKAVGGRKGSPDKAWTGPGAKGDGKARIKGKNDSSNGKQGKGMPCAICGPEKGKNDSIDAFQCTYEAEGRRQKSEPQSASIHWC